MAVSVEFLKDDLGARTGRAWIAPCIAGASAAGMAPHRSKIYDGRYTWLSLYGAGDPNYNRARTAHLDKGRPVACWDMGYLSKARDLARTHVRVSLNADHPSLKHIDLTHPDPSRWRMHNIGLRHDASSKGHVVVVGMGVKSREHLGLFDWEERALKAAAERFPDRRIVYRPKPTSREEDMVQWEDRSDAATPIASILKGASLVICRHSNVAIDACIAGVPVECEGGAALWLYRHGTTPTIEQRLDFLHRIAWWNWKLVEHDMRHAWAFLIRIHEGKHGSA